MLFFFIKNPYGKPLFMTVSAKLVQNTPNIFQLLKYLTQKGSENSLNLFNCYKFYVHRTESLMHFGKTNVHIVLVFTQMIFEVFYVYNKMIF